MAELFKVMPWKDTEEARADAERLMISVHEALLKAADGVPKWRIAMAYGGHAGGSEKMPGGGHAHNYTLKSLAMISGCIGLDVEITFKPKVK